jgi:CRP-like cAMP-binding protein
MNPFTMTSLNITQILADSPVRKVKRGEILLRNGDHSDCIYFVISGCLRSYTIDSKGKEHVFQFAPEDWIISDQEALLNKGFSSLNIDAVENSEIKLIKRPQADIALLDKPSMLDLNQKLLRRNYTLQKRVIQLLSASAEERYLEFLNLYPQLAQRIPQKMIASYLGITPEGLSRVRKQLGNKKF